MTVKTNQSNKLSAEIADSNNVIENNQTNIPRGAVRRYREHLNTLCGDNKHKHNRYQQRTRKYGDYLYHQDRERFIVELLEWLKNNP